MTRLICAQCGHQIVDASDLVKKGDDGDVEALLRVVIQEDGDDEVRWTPGWVCRNCDGAQKRPAA